MLPRQGTGWTASLPLRGVRRPAEIAADIAGVDGATLVDLKAESDRLLGVYLREGVSLAGAGAAAICLLLLASLRSLARLGAVLAPLAIAVVVTLAALRIGGHALSIFNLFGLLLVVAIGSTTRCSSSAGTRNRPACWPRSLWRISARWRVSAVLALSRTPVLHDLGQTVAIGALLSLVSSCIMLSRPSPP